MADDRSVVNQIRDFLRRPSIRFEGGEIHTKDDSVNGYVSLLNNMECEDRSVRRRLGSKCLNDPDEIVRFDALFEQTITGCSVLFGIKDDGIMVAFLDEFPEKELVVCARGIRQNKDGNYRVKFDRGDKYWVIPSTNEFSVYNNYGDVFSIRKDGYIQFLKEHESSDELKLPYQIDLARNYNVDSIYLDVTNVINKKIDSFYVVEDSKKKFAAIDGSVRVAAVNDNEVVSRVTKPIRLSDPKNVYVAVVPCVSGTDFLSDFLGMSVSSYDDKTTVVRNANYNLVAGVETGYEDENYQISAPRNSDATDFDDATVMLYHVREDDEDVWYLVFDYQTWSTSTDLDNVEQYQNIIALKEIETLDTSLDTTSIFTISSSVATWRENDSAVTTWIRREEQNQIAARIDAVLSDVDGMAYKYDSTSTAFDIKAQTAAGFYYDNAKLFRITMDVSDIGSLDGVDCETSVLKDITGATILDNIVGIHRASLRIKEKATGFDFADHAFVYANSNIPGSSYFALNHLGYDCWSAEEKELSYLTSNMEVDFFTKKIKSSDDADIIVFDTEAYLDWFQNGSRFATIIDDNVVKISQRCFYKVSNPGVPVYEEADAGYESKSYYEGPPLTGRVVNQTPSSYGVGYMPVSALEYMQLDSFQFTPDETRVPITATNGIAASGGKLFVLQGSRVWIGDQEKRMLEIAVPTTDTPTHIAGFLNGAILGSSNGIKYINSKGEFESVAGYDSTGKSVKAMKGFDGAAVVVFDDNTVVVVVSQLAYGRYFPNAKEITRNVEDYQFDGNTHIAMCNDTIYISMKRDIVGFSKGGWKKHLTFDQDIYMIASYRNRLVVSFYDDTIIAGARVQQLPEIELMS